MNVSKVKQSKKTVSTVSAIASIENEELQDAIHSLNAETAIKKRERRQFRKPLTDKENQLMSMNALLTNVYAVWTGVEECKDVIEESVINPDECRLNNVYLRMHTMMNTFNEIAEEVNRLKDRLETA